MLSNVDKLLDSIFVDYKDFTLTDLDIIIVYFTSFLRA